MKKKVMQNLQENTISLTEFASDFTAEQKKIVEDEVRYYDVLIRLKELRKKLGLTQRQLAQKAEIPRTTVTKIESGSYNPTLNTLMQLASALDKKLEIRFI